MINKIKKLLAIKWDDVENYMFDNKDEFVSFDEQEFDSYRQYDKAYPDRFRVKYDENLNRIWK